MAMAGEPYDWYVIERVEHDGREWIEKIRPHSYAFRTSARFSDADVEGPGEEMKAIAKAIRERTRLGFRRYCVDARPDQFDRVLFISPRNSQEPGECTYAEALELADIIDERIK